MEKKDYTFFWRMLTNNTGKHSVHRLLALLLMFSSRLSYGQGYIQASTYLGGSGSENTVPITYVVNGETYILGTTPSSNFPVTTGAAYGGGSSDLTVTKLSATGAVVWSRFLGGSAEEYSAGIVVSNGSVFILGSTKSTNYPVTNGTTSSNSGVYTKLDAATGAIQFSTYMPGGEFIKVDNGSVYIFGGGYGNGIPFEISKYDVTTNALLLHKTINAGSSYNPIGQAEVVDGIIYWAGQSTGISNDYPTTDGTKSGGRYEIFYTKLDGLTGDVLFSTMLDNQCNYPAPSNNPVVYDLDHYFDIKDGGVYFYSYITGCASDFVTTDGSAIPANPWYGSFLRKYDAISNKILYSKIFNFDFDIVKVENGIVYLGHSTADFNHIAFNKLNAATGAIIYSGSLNSNSNEYLLDMKVKNGDLYLLGTTKGDATNSYPVTNGSTKRGAVDSTDYVFTKINTNNQICYSTFLGGNNSEYNGGSLLVDNDFAYVTSISRLTDYPVTNSSSNRGAYDFVWTKLKIPSTFQNLSPISQTVCKNSEITEISGPELLSILSTSQPLIYRNGVSSPQPTITFGYQWQQSSAAGGSWVNVSGAGTQINYTPQPSSDTTYYRRLINVSTSAAAIGSSSVSTIVNNSNTIPSSINVSSTSPQNIYKTDGTISISGFTASNIYKISYNFNNIMQTAASYQADATGVIKILGFTKGAYDSFNIKNIESSCSTGVFSGKTATLVDQ